MPKQQTFCRPRELSSILTSWAETKKNTKPTHRSARRNHSKSIITIDLERMSSNQALCSWWHRIEKRQYAFIQIFIK
jgi:hypothetical protein